MSLRRSLLALATAVLAVLGVALAGGPAQAANTVEIAVHGTGQCLDNATENAAKLQMWRCTGGSEQHWVQLISSTTGYLMYQNAHTDWCITAPSGPGGGSVVMQPCDTSAPPDQQWTQTFTTTPVGFPFAEYWVIENPATGLCLWTGSIANGTVPSMAGCDTLGSLDNRWDID